MNSQFESKADGPQQTTSCMTKTFSNTFSDSLPDVAKMASHAIFQYNVLAIDDTHNTWTNMIVKMTILRLLDSSDDKEKISVARPEGPPLRWFQSRKDKN